MNLQSLAAALATISMVACASAPGNDVSQGSEAFGAEASALGVNAPAPPGVAPGIVVAAPTAGTVAQGSTVTRRVTKGAGWLAGTTFDSYMSQGGTLTVGGQTIGNITVTTVTATSPNAAPITSITVSIPTAAGGTETFTGTAGNQGPVVAGSVNGVAVLMSLPTVSGTVPAGTYAP